MRNILKSYRHLQSHIVNLLIAEFFVQLINVAFFLILNIYMSKKGYADFKIADFISYRFLAVMLISFPLGFYIKNRKLKPLFFIASILVPLMSLSIIYAIDQNLNALIYASLIIWGLAYICIEVTIVPYILRNEKMEYHSEAIVLKYAAWSVSMLLSGVLIFILEKWFPDFFDEKILLYSFSFIGLAGVYFVAKIKDDEVIPKRESEHHHLNKNDWLLIMKALVPTFIIAVGAGLTIPFINLFFYHVFAVDSHQFSLIGSGTALLVTVSHLLVPHIKKKYGYEVAITLTQSLAIVSLILLATTEYLNQYAIGLWLAIIFFSFRQPLMNMAAPMTSELAMYYVGEKNQEMLSALISAIWAGSWFFSSQIFRILRLLDLKYSSIFYITSGLYAVGVILYAALINDFHKRKVLEK